MDAYGIRHGVNGVVVFSDLKLRFAQLDLLFLIPGLYVHYAWMWVFFMIVDRIELNDECSEAGVSIGYLLALLPKRFNIRLELYFVVF